ncbi:MAG: hypothetical protein RL518_27 [Pseudomonadota bacterium]|jgi:hypothetical protein
MREEESQSRDPATVEEVRLLPTSESDDNAIICFCYRLTAGMLRDTHRKLGCLQEVERVTRAGQGCSGCQVVLQSMFGETPSDTHTDGLNPMVGSSCFKPGTKLMKGFIVSSDELESTVYSSNGVAPALGGCDASMDVEYAVVDHQGSVVLSNSVRLSTNETFSFDTASAPLPKPFYGMFVMQLGRANVGASRFNIFWRDRHGGASSTHENGSTGRPKVWLPLLFTKETLASQTSFHLAVMNPHSVSKPFTVTVTDTRTKRSLVWKGGLNPYCVTWIDVSRELCAPALTEWPEGRLSVQLRTDDLDMYTALSTYLFTRNASLGLWSCNHL